MLADSDGQAASNGTERAYANGKSHHRTVPAASANGTHKPVVSTNGSSKSRPPDTYLGHDREEVTRILIQALSDMGYHSAAQSVSRDSGYELESPTVAAFRNAVLEGAWDEAEELLFGAATPEDRSNQNGNGLVLAPGTDRNVMRFWIRQQKFLELLEQRETSRALTVLRTELTPLYQDTHKLHFLSSLLMCQSPDDLKSKSEWDGAYGQSRQILLSELSKCISASVMLPEHRLAVLLHQVKQSQIGMCMYHSSSDSPSLYADHNCDRRQFPSENIIELDDHTGEVWQVVFSHDGTKLASCGGDKQVIIWDVPSFKAVHYLKDHDAGVGNVAWSWDDSMLVTCCQDRHARLWDPHTGNLIRKLERFAEPVSSCIWAADGHTFITGALDKTRSICQWNLNGDKVFDWANAHRVEDLAVSPDGHWLVAMDDRHHIHVYNFVTRELAYKMDLQVRLTSISISQDSRYLLVNHTNGVARLIDLVNREPVQTYSGHTGGDYLIRTAFGGANESFVISGSEDGLINIWHKASAVPIEKLNGHHPRCNAVTWSPTDPCLFASCGDDGKIKIWSNNEWRRSHNEATHHNHETGRSSNGWRGEMGEA
ncbi:WD40-repeat-containing domain protein [Pseudomassariella vexata]|uniref:WD40-repeat-containing domain protein n=1 Tax=Pseudomassariella vexata TaxID=1141098 RepID=A0A1Y2EHX8_9PEZI|nr:WD40-repeat-containing domain protein [Pseudomassariella vexata]ORY71181.1 WD40-repeat-containing domain protein [Pseudomassariella vexata]